jgi:hypothetical protein
LSKLLKLPKGNRAPAARISYCLPVVRFSRRTAQEMGAVSSNYLMGRIRMLLQFTVPTIFISIEGFSTAQRYILHYEKLTESENG